MTTIFKSHMFCKPFGDDAIYLKQYEQGYTAAMLGKPDCNPYKIPQYRPSARADMQNMYWQAGYDEYEGQA